MGNAPIRNEQRRANDEAHEARIAKFEQSEAAARARKESAAGAKPTPEVESVKAEPATLNQTED